MQVAMIACRHGAKSAGNCAIVRLMSRLQGSLLRIVGPPLLQESHGISVRIWRLWRCKSTVGMCARIGTGCCV